MEIYILYGSQTGQAEAIAEGIHEAAETNEIKSSLMCLKQAEEAFRIVKKGQVPVIFVCSTTGDGELPENSRKFMRILNRKTHPDDLLKNLNYALLGLGDTNYSTFCGGPKTLERGLKKLGANSFYATGYADDGTDLEMVVEPWIQGLWPRLKEFLKQNAKQDIGPRSALNTSGEDDATSVAEVTTSMANSAGQNGVVSKPDEINSMLSRQGPESGEGITSQDAVSAPTSPANPVAIEKSDQPRPEVGLELSDSPKSQQGIGSASALRDSPIPSSREGVQKVLQADVQNDKLAMSSTILKSDNNESSRNAVDPLSQIVSSESRPSGVDVADNLVSLSLKSNLRISGVSKLHNLSGLTSGTLPPLMQSYIAIKPIKEEDDYPVTNDSPFVPYPLAVDSACHRVKIQSMERLTTDDTVKTAYCVTLRVDDFFYEPGDSFGVIARNPTEEVEWLIERLDLGHLSDRVVEIKIDENTKKKNPKLPNFLPKITTIRHILQNCLEIRSVPKRTFLRALLEFTSSDEDRNILRQLCRKESMDDFSAFVREPNLSLIDLLSSLPSCKPPFGLLLEHLPRIKARLYSAASSLDPNPGLLKFVFNVVEIDASCGRMYSRKGVFTGYMESLYRSSSQGSFDDDYLTIFRTKNSSFRLPAVVDRPIVMVGPGTGVAPFIGFLESLQGRFKDEGSFRPETWLFYGCRHQARDFLFQKELRHFVETRCLTHLEVAFSRDVTSCHDGNVQVPKYVQDKMKIRSSEILRLLLRDNAIFYVCGDAKHMARDVRELIVAVLSQEMEKDSADEFFKSLVKNGRYKEDVWT